MTLEGRAIAGGRAEGVVLRSTEPISFYGAVDPETGDFTEEGHELDGENVAGRVLVFPKGKGSTVGSYVIYGLAANGVAPAAIVNAETETIVATGAILGEIPCVDGVDLDAFETGETVTVDGDAGTVMVDGDTERVMVDGDDEPVPDDRDPDTAPGDSDSGTVPDGSDPGTIPDDNDPGTVTR